MPTRKKVIKINKSPVTKNKKLAVEKAETPSNASLMSTVITDEDPPASVPVMSVIPEVPHHTEEVIPDGKEPIPHHIEEKPANSVDVEVERIESVAEQSDPEEQMGPLVVHTSRKSMFVVFVGIGFILGLVSAFIIFSFFKKPDKESALKPSPKDSIATASPLPSPQFDTSAWIWEVQNGSGVKGAAQEAADELKEMGFEVESVGNATNSSFVGYSIFTVEDLASSSAALLTYLDDTFEDASLSGTFVPSKEATATVRLIIGK